LHGHMIYMRGGFLSGAFDLPGSGSIIGKGLTRCEGVKCRKKMPIGDIRIVELGSGCAYGQLPRDRERAEHIP